LDDSVKSTPVRSPQFESSFVSQVMPTQLSVAKHSNFASINDFVALPDASLIKIASSFFQIHESAQRKTTNPYIYKSWRFL